MFISATGIFAQNTAFAYQGLLSTNGVRANGTFDLQFSLFDLATDGIQRGETITVSNVTVVDGVFTVQLDFGASFFIDNTGQFLQIGIRSSDSDGLFSLLSPRSPISPAPYAIKSLSADTATTAITATTANTAASATNATQLGGIDASQFIVTTDLRLSDARIPAPGSPNYIQNGTASSPV